MMAVRAVEAVFRNYFEHSRVVGGAVASGNPLPRIAGETQFSPLFVPRGRALGRGAATCSDPAASRKRRVIQTREKTS
jgi:hypothetical protein